MVSYIIEKYNRMKMILSSMLKIFMILFEEKLRCLEMEKAVKIGETVYKNIHAVIWIRNVSGK